MGLIAAIDRHQTGQHSAPAQSRPIVQRKTDLTILGVIVRTRPGATEEVRAKLRARPGVDIAADPGDGRLILVIDDCEAHSAPATLGELATWPNVINTSLVYEYSGPDSPPAGPALDAYQDWRAGLGSIKA